MKGIRKWSTPDSVKGERIVRISNRETMLLFLPLFLLCLGIINGFWAPLNFFAVMPSVFIAAMPALLFAPSEARYSFDNERKTLVFSLQGMARLFPRGSDHQDISVTIEYQNIRQIILYEGNSWSSLAIKGHFAQKDSLQIFRKFQNRLFLMHRAGKSETLETVRLLQEHFTAASVKHCGSFYGAYIKNSLTFIILLSVAFFLIVLGFTGLDLTRPEVQEIALEKGDIGNNRVTHNIAGLEVMLPERLVPHGTDTRTKIFKDEVTGENIEVYVPFRVARREVSYDVFRSVMGRVLGFRSEYEYYQYAYKVRFALMGLIYKGALLSTMEDVRFETFETRWHRGHIMVATEDGKRIAEMSIVTPDHDMEILVKGSSSSLSSDWPVDKHLLTAIASGQVFAQ